MTVRLPSGRQLSAPIRVLVVDDCADDRLMYGYYLRTNGIDCRAVDNAHEARALAKTFAPDLIITDLFMSGTDGFELIRSLKSNDYTRDIPLIAVSALRTRADGALAHALGSDRVLVKPCPPDELLEAVMELVGEGTATPRRVTK